MSAQNAAIENYLRQLREELSGCDSALIQDALYDTEDHLLSELHAAPGTSGATSDAEVSAVLARFGSPSEVAQAWKETEQRVAAALLPHPLRRPEGERTMPRALDVFTDPRTYSALLYMLLSLATGTLYFSWVVTGLSLSIGLSVLIFGIPVFLLFLASVRALALVEGRVVETLLGVRMPRRQPPEVPGTLWIRLKGWLGDRRTWLTMLYMVLGLPFGVLYFTLAVTLLSLVLGFFLGPIFQLWMNGTPVININGWIVPGWALPLSWVLSFVLLFGTLHLARLVGRGHAALARAMLVEG